MSLNYLYYADALQLLEKMESDVVSLAFLDPPMGTGGDFYEKNRGNSIEHVLYDLSEYYSKVFQQLKRILKDDGFLFLYTLPNTPINFKLILEQVFERNINDRLPYEITIKHTFIGNSRNLHHDHETILIFSKSGNYDKLNEITRPLNSEELRRYNKKDKEGRFQIHPLLISHNSFLNYNFEWMGVRPAEGRYWRYKKEKLDDLYNDNKIYFNSDGVPLLKIYEREVKVGTNWNDITTMIPPFERTKFSGQKSLRLMERIIKLGSNEGDIILDPFVGSGTTLLAASENNRYWIGIDNCIEAIEVSEKRLSESRFISVKSREIIEEMPIINNIYNNIVLHTNELTKLQSDYNKLTKNLYNLKSLLKIEDTTTEEIINRLEDWIFNVNKIDTKVPEVILNDIEKRLVDFFCDYWKNDSIELDTKKYLKTSELIYENMNIDIYNEQLDFSPAVITLTKAVENEFYHKVYKAIENYCINTFSERRLNDWPKALVIKGTNPSKRTFTFGSILHILFYDWNKNEDTVSIKNIVRQLNLFNPEADIFEHSKRNELKSNLETLKNYRNDIAHKDYIPIETAKDCRDIILFEKKVLLKLLSMFQ